MAAAIRRVAVGAKRVALPMRLSLALPSREGLAVVQIGSNDGRSGDPIRRLVLRNRRWTGLFVEPIPYLFEALRAGYGDQPRFTFDRVAISGTDGSRTFYFVDPGVRAVMPDLPPWVEQLGSFDRAHIDRHFGTRLIDHVRTLEVPTLTLNSLLERHGVTRLDLLHVDTEGHDYEIVRQVDFARFRPRVILFEHRHLAPEARRAAVRLVKDNGFRVERWGGDYLCTVRRWSPGGGPG